MSWKCIYDMNITNVPLDFGNGKKFITSQPWCEFLSTASSVFIVGGSGNKLLFLAPLRFGRMLGTSLIFSLGVVELVTLHSGLKRENSTIIMIGCAITSKVSNQHFLDDHFKNVQNKR